MNCKNVALKIPYILTEKRDALIVYVSLESLILSLIRSYSQFSVLLLISSLFCHFSSISLLLSISLFIFFPFLLLHLFAKPPFDGGSVVCLNENSIVVIVSRFSLFHSLPFLDSAFSILLFLRLTLSSWGARPTTTTRLLLLFLFLLLRFFSIAESRHETLSHFVSHCLSVFVSWIKRRILTGGGRNMPPEDVLAQVDDVVELCASPFFLPLFHIYFFVVVVFFLLQYQREIKKSAESYCSGNWEKLKTSSLLSSSLLFFSSNEHSLSDKMPLSKVHISSISL